MRRLQDERGFTLLELMIVVMIIGILAGTAVPAFARTKDRASDRATQKSLVDGAKGVLIVGLATGRFPSTATLLSDLTTLETAYTWLDPTVPSTDNDQISVLQDGGEVELASMSETGTCFYLRAVLDGETQYHREDGGTCTADYFKDVAAAGW